MILGIGVDIAEIDRFKPWCSYSSEQLSRIFSPKELEQCKRNGKLSADRLASRFAAKEAFFKATQIKIKKWNEVVVKYHNNGKPYLVYDKDLVDFEIKNMDCSISHDGEYAIGNVVVLTNSPN